MDWNARVSALFPNFSKARIAQANIRTAADTVRAWVMTVWQTSVKKMIYCYCHSTVFSCVLKTCLNGSFASRLYPELHWHTFGRIHTPIRETFF